MTCAALTVPLAAALATYELTAVYVLAAVAAVVVFLALYRVVVAEGARQAWRGLRSLRDRPAQLPVRPGPESSSPESAPLALVAAEIGATRKPRSIASVIGLLFVVAAGAGLAWIAALLGTKGLAAAVGGVAIACLLAFVRDKTVFFTFAAVSSLTFVLHKSIGPQDLEQSGGAISVYITSFDLLVLLLYGLWIWEGTFAADIRAAARRPLIWLPLACLTLLLPSLLVAPSLVHSASELTRMGWMYLLYAYVAIRVRTVRHVVSVLLGLAAIAVVELVVVVLQWRTGGVLGLSFLGVPTSLGERTTDSEVIGRPFGTMVHPVFMAAALGIIAMVALAFALELTSTAAKLSAIGVTGACLACMWISQTRASFVAAVMAGGFLVLVALIRRRLTWRTLGAFSLAGLVGVALFWSRISEKLVANFGTGHYQTEIASRLELNAVALRMIEDNLLLGAGLNNFETVLPRYEANPVIFFGHPVHNLYLLFLAEVGIVGFVGVVVLGLALYDAAIRLGRSQDRILAGVGIGAAGAMGFLMLEELLGFSLRQDIPLALFWLLAGLVAAGTQMAGMRWPDRAARSPQDRSTSESARAPRPRAGQHATLGRAVLRRRILSRVTLASTLLGLVLTAGPLLPPAGVDSAVAAPSPPGVIFTADSRSTGTRAIYAADADGGRIRKLTPDDGRYYDWPRFAFGNTKIIYTVRTLDPGAPEDIMLMDTDGSSPRLLKHFEYRVAQPLVDPSGRYVIYNGSAPWFPRVALYRLDLATMESRNLTAVTQRIGFDADPFLSADGRRLLLVNNHSRRGTQLAEMTPDGTQRRFLTAGNAFDTDPGLSPDGSLFASSSYRGPGQPGEGRTAGGSRVRPGDWQITVRKRTGGRERVLTQGQDCTVRQPDDPCAPQDASGWVPRFLNDSSGVSFIAALDQTRVCICALGVDGNNPRIIVDEPDLAIDWYDWPQLPGSVTSTDIIGTEQSDSSLLLTAGGPDNKNHLIVASPDLMDRLPIALPKRLQPLEAAWGSDRRSILFTAKVPLPSRARPHPAAPPGKTRRTHITLSDLDPVATNQRMAESEKTRAEVAQRQVFLRAADGRIRQLTDPWIEDWQDGVPDGDVRGSSRPRMSPDGRFVVVTNTSTLTGESFLLRIDLRTGGVVNLTNATAGAVPTDDSAAVFSPDGSRLSFAWTKGTQRGIYTMNAETGHGVQQFVDDPGDAETPAWSPKGSLLAYVSRRQQSRTVVRATRIASGRGTETATLSVGQDSAWAPVVSPEGDRVAYLARWGNLANVYVADVSSGGQNRPLQPDLQHNVLSVDWR